MRGIGWLGGLVGVLAGVLAWPAPAAPVKAGREEAVPAAGLRFRVPRDAAACPLPAVEGGRVRRSDTGEELELFKPRDLWFHDQCAGYWSGPGVKLYAGRPSLVPPDEVPRLFEDFARRSDYEGWRSQAGPPEDTPEAVQAWVVAFAGAEPDGAALPPKDSPAARIQPFRFRPAADGAVRDGYWLVSRKDPAQRRFLLYVLTPGADLERSRKNCLQAVQAATFLAFPADAGGAARQRPAARGVSRPVESPEYAADRARVIQNLRGLKDWWYLETADYILVANLKDRSTVVELQKTLEATRLAVTGIFPQLRPLEAVSVVRVFATRAGYLDYVGQERAWSGGLWDARRDELVISPAEASGGGVRRAQLLRTVRHECFHQYLFYAAGQLDAAPWFNEGGAALFEDLVRPAGPGGGPPELAPEPARLEAARTLVGEAGYSSRDLVAMDYRAFVAGAREQLVDRYVGAWALMYFLVKGAPVVRGMEKYAAIPERYYRTLVETRDPVQANAAAWQGVDRDRFDADWRKFWKSRTLVSRAGR